MFPAIDITKSGTRREDLLLDREEQEAVYIMRKAINGMQYRMRRWKASLNMFVTHQEITGELCADGKENENYIKILA